jgi:hypothetical protein
MCSEHVFNPQRVRSLPNNELLGKEMKTNSSFFFGSFTQVQGAVDSGIPTQLSYGFISGYCSGIALKKIGRGAAVVFGTFLLENCIALLSNFFKNDLALLDIHKTHGMGFFLLNSAQVLVL